MWSLFLIPIWYHFYNHSPYLFQGISCIFYMIGINYSLVNVLIGIPIDPFYNKHSLKDIRYNIPMEYVRIVLLSTGFMFERVVNPFAWTMFIYSVATLVTILARYTSIPNDIMLLLKGWTYILGIILFLDTHLYDPLSVLIAIPIFFCNVVIDFGLDKAGYVLL